MDRTVYCVGGGMSLEGFDFRRLDGKRVVAVNKAFRDLPRAEVVYFTDARFFNWYRDELVRHPARKVTGASPKLVNHPDVENWVLTSRSGLDTRHGCLVSGNNSGYAAINLAVHMGARTIVLLGYDMKAPGEAEDDISRFTERVHYHSGYPVAQRRNVFSKMRPYFPKLAERLDELGIKVLNANPDSALDCFEKVPLDQVC